MGALLTALLALGLGGQAAIAPTGAEPTPAQIVELPLAFEPSAGRASADTDFIAHSVAGGTLGLGSGRAELVLPSRSGEARTLSLTLEGAAPDARPSALGELPGRVNSFIGDDPSRWRTGIPTYERVRYHGVYPGIDVDFYGNQRNLEYDFRLAPGADPRRISVALAGADSVRLTSAGDLAIELGKTTVRQLAPVAHQRIGGVRRAVPVSFALSAGRVRFELGAYDRSQPLVIDPVVLAYSTYLGGSGGDSLSELEVDAAGAVYVAGDSSSLDYPTEDGLPGGPPGGGLDAVLTKLNPDSGGAVSLAYSTYIGGTGAEFADGLAIDASGAAYIVGNTASTNFPTVDQLQADQPVGDGFVAKFSPDSGGAVSLAYSTYLGADGFDLARDVAVDATGAAYIVGETGSTTFPIQDQLAFTGADQPGFDGFVTKFDPDSGGAITLAYSTYLGGNAADGAEGVAVDSAGAAYVGGETASTDFPTQTPAQGDEDGLDGFVAKLDPGGAADFDFSTYLGGDALDRVRRIAVEPGGDAYAVGETDSINFPTLSPLHADRGVGDAFVTRFDSGGTAVVGYSTYLGGDSTDSAAAVDVGADGTVLVSGETFSANFPTMDAFQPARDGTSDAFVTRFVPNAAGPPQLDLSTYLGGSESDSGAGAAAGANGTFWVAGTTLSPNFPTQDPFQTEQGATDGFVARFEPAPPQATEPPDTTPPETTIVKGPKRKTKKRKAKFVFESSEPGSTFECKLDKKPFSPCAASAKFKVKRKPKRHKLAVRAIDPAGNADPSPAVGKWRLKPPA